jgi:hypothetical protein
LEIKSTQPTSELNGAPSVGCGALGVADIINISVIDLIAIELGQPKKSRYRSN